MTYTETVLTQLDSTIYATSSPAVDDGKATPTFPDLAEAIGTMGDPL